jgi:hypothetical protein
MLLSHRRFHICCNSRWSPVSIVSVFSLCLEFSKRVVINHLSGLESPGSHFRTSRFTLLYRSRTSRRLPYLAGASPSGLPLVTRMTVYSMGESGQGRNSGLCSCSIHKVMTWDDSTACHTERHLTVTKPWLTISTFYGLKLL